jgi:mannose-6-phosphate isomerase-like protein (cupin superfamily)
MIPAVRRKHMRSTYHSIQPYVTKDGSEIRELMHPAVHGNRNQSLAEATVQPGKKTVLHRHQLTEEIYYVAHGAGIMTLGGERFAVVAGDTICISPGTLHCIENTGEAPLKILCACSPAYAHGDTELLGPGRLDV